MGRAYAGLAAVVCAMRVVETWRDARFVVPRPLAVLLPLDLASLRRGPPRLERAVLVRALLHATIGLAGLALLMQREETPAPALAAWAGGLVALYGAVEALTSAVRLFFFALGVESAPVQVDPIFARSVGEHWSERWNRAVGVWLRRFVFRPVARRLGARAGALATFAYSGRFHAYLVLVAAGWRWALPMAGFFAVQGVAVVLETRLRIARWPTPLAHAWTIGWLLGSSPLFVYPMLACFGVVVRSGP
jgi:hypothetical protein